jgi:hypothetical protein
MFSARRGRFAGHSRPDFATNRCRLRFRTLLLKTLPVNHLAASRSHSTSELSSLEWILFCGETGNSNEKDNRECGDFSGADVFDGDCRGTTGRRCARSCFGGRRAGSDRRRRRSCHRLDGRPVNFAFVGLAPRRRVTPCAESRKPDRWCLRGRQPTGAQSARGQPACCQGSSSSASRRTVAAVRHHHGVHRTAGPATGVSWCGAARSRGGGAGPIQS